MNTISVIIETPKGSNLKYYVDERTRFIKLHKILPVGMMFPYDFGFLPGTKGEDGDPLDVIVISEFPGFPACEVECRLIGGFKAEQSKEPGSSTMIRNDRFFAVPLLSIVFQKVRDTQDMPDKLIKETEAFFIQYNKLEKKKFSVLKTWSGRQALKVIKAALDKK